MSRRCTQPPRVPALLPIGVAGMLVGQQALAVAADALAVLSLGDADTVDLPLRPDVVGYLTLAGQTALDFVLLAAWSFALRWLVRRWTRQ